MTSQLIYPLQKETSSAKEYAIISKFCESLSVSDVQQRESIESIKASCMGLFEVLDDLRGNRVTINNKNNRTTSLSGRNGSTESDSNSGNKDNDDENSDEDDKV